VPSLDAVAREALLANGFVPEAGDDVVRELASLHDAPTKGDSVKDLRVLKWSSIDNASSRDLDQIEVAEELSDGSILLRIGIADVDALVPKGAAIDAHAMPANIATPRMMATWNGAGRWTSAPVVPALM